MAPTGSGAVGFPGTGGGVAAGAAGLLGTGGGAAAEVATGIGGGTGGGIAPIGGGAAAGGVATGAGTGTGGGITATGAGAAGLIGSGGGTATGGFGGSGGGRLGPVPEAVVVVVTGGGEGLKPGSSCRLRPSSAFSISFMDCQRAFGSLRRHMAMICSNSIGTPGARSGIGFTSSRRTAESVEIPDPPSKARRPVTISYRTEPKEKISERASTRLPSACSGDM